MVRALEQTDIANVIIAAHGIGEGTVRVVVIDKSMEHG
jgi:hypothetical protein